MLIIKSINCDSVVETRNYEKIDDFVEHVNTFDEEKVWTAPMLDDPIHEATINGIKIENVEIINDLLEIIY